MPRSNRDIIVEFIQQGSYIKVSAIDARTGLEVSIVGDPKQSQKALEEAAMKKLEYVRARRRQQREQKMQPKRRDYRSTSGWDL